MKKDTLSKILAIFGTLLLCAPYVLAVTASIRHLIGSHQFMFDYLIPGELFFFVLGGGILLVWAAFRAHLHKKLIIWTMGLALAFLVIGLVLAQITGLAAGDIQPEGFWFTVVAASIGLYSLLGLCLCVEGIILSIDLFKTPKNL